MANAKPGFLEEPEVFRPAAASRAQLEQCDTLVAPDEAEEQGLTLLDPVS